MSDHLEPENPFSAPGGESASDPGHKLTRALTVLTASLAVLFVNLVLSQLVLQWYVASTGPQSAPSQRLAIVEWLPWLTIPLGFGSCALRYWGLMTLKSATSHRLTQRLATVTLLLTATNVMLAVVVMAYHVTSRSGAISVMGVLSSTQAYVLIGGKITLMLTLYHVAIQVSRPDLARWFVFMAAAEACLPIAGRLYSAEMPHLQETLMLANWGLQVASIAFLFALLTAARMSIDAPLSHTASADA